MPSLPLFAGSFETVKPANPLFCHQDFLEKLEALRTQPIGKRASLLMQRLAVDERREHFKATHGVNRGWRRSRLGGNQGSHFYAWWAPRLAVPLREGSGFDDTPEGSIILRDIRHHDDHSQLFAQSLQDNYLPVSVQDLRMDAFGPEPWTPPQVKFASARGNIKTLKGHPGSGKTTALLHAADATGAQRVLYLTFSRDLAVLAREYFDRFCSKGRVFQVMTFDSFIRYLLNEDAPRIPDSESRRKFQSDLYPYARHIVPWNDRLPALWDEFHAHVVGAAIPMQIGRFERAQAPKVSGPNYRERRTRYLGAAAANAVMDAASRLDKMDRVPLAERYFPELALAWRASAAIMNLNLPPELMETGCIAIDECQDLTPIEAFTLVFLGFSINLKTRRSVSVLVAGDEAQTVRATDFEWAWMNDMLHNVFGSHSEYKLMANLRSPQRIAHLVNRVWDLYEVLEKRDRPGGVGYATIDDDANDQVLYCTAAPGAELNELLDNLAAREGLALITMEDTVPASVPEHLRANVLTPAEAKGLDFHSVCLLNAGPLLDRIIKADDRLATVEIEGIRKRLCIDRMRVALSRPTERLLWLDINPGSYTVENSVRFLDWGSNGRVVPSVPSALLQTLEEERLDVEERIQRCMVDARQYLGVKPDLAWSRAQQAVALLGLPEWISGVKDEALRNSANMTLAEICFVLAFRNARLAPHLGHPDLFQESIMAADRAKRNGTAAIIGQINRVLKANPDVRIQPLADLAQTLARFPDQMEPWIQTEIAAKAKFWVEELEAAISMGNNAAIMINILPPFYDALSLPDAAARKQRLHQRSIQILLKNRKFEEALRLMQSLTERDYKLEAQALDSLGRFAEAAEAFQKAGDVKEAIRCYRMVPDFDAAFKLIRDVGDHPALESYEWLQQLNALIAKKPEKFNRVMLAPEKKLLEQSLEGALGVVRKKAATKRAATKKAVKKAAPKKTAVKKPVRLPRSDWF